MENEDVEDLLKKCICKNCVREPYLNNEVRKLGESRRCSYCHRRAKAFFLDEAANRIEKALGDFYERTPNEPEGWDYYRQKEFGETWLRDGEPITDVIEEAAIIPMKAASDIQKILEEKHNSYDHDDIGFETEYSSDSYYDLKSHDDVNWKNRWDSFEQLMKHEGRIFNDEAKQILASIFDGIGELRTHKRAPVIIDAGPKTKISFLYRARTFTADGALKEALENPDKQLGPPPAKFATAGRMNSRGIPVFYGANTARVAISEVRPPVGSKVVVASFKIIRPLKLLDLEALTEIIDSGSIFDPRELGRRQKQAFLRTLTKLLTIPVMPGQEDLEYIPTQAVADFLAAHVNPTIDGIQFSSVQSGGKGKNVVLFHKSSAVEPLLRPAGTDIKADIRSDEDEFLEYTVFENQPAPKEIPTLVEKSELAFPLLPDITDTSTSKRLNTLRLNKKSIQIHAVNATEFKTAKNLVHWVKSEWRGDLDDVTVFGTR